MSGSPSTLQSETSRPPTLVSASRNSTVTEGLGAAQTARAAGAVQVCHSTDKGAATSRSKVSVAKRACACSYADCMPS